jgi:hypothetical protein
VSCAGSPRASCRCRCPSPTCGGRRAGAFAAARERDGEVEAGRALDHVDAALAVDVGEGAVVHEDVGRAVGGVRLRAEGAVVHLAVARAVVPEDETLGRDGVEADLELAVEVEVREHRVGDHAAPDDRQHVDGQAVKRRRASHPSMAPVSAVDARRPRPRSRRPPRRTPRECPTRSRACRRRRCRRPPASRRCGRADRLAVVGVEQTHGVGGHRRAVGVPDVDVLIHGGRDDLEARLACRGRRARGTAKKPAPSILVLGCLAWRLSKFIELGPARRAACRRARDEDQPSQVVTTISSVPSPSRSPTERAASSPVMRGDVRIDAAVLRDAVGLVGLDNAHELPRALVGVRWVHRGASRRGRPGSPRPRCRPGL